MNVRDQQRYRRRRQQQSQLAMSPSMASTSTMDQEEHQYQQQYQQQKEHQQHFQHQQQQQKQKQDQQQQQQHQRRNSNNDIPGPYQQQKQKQQQHQRRNSNNDIPGPELSRLEPGGAAPSKQQRQQQQERQQQLDRSLEHERIHQEHERSRHEYQQQRVVFQQEQQQQQQQQQRVSQEPERSQEHERIYQEQQSHQQRPQQQQSQWQRPQQRVSQEPERSQPHGRIYQEQQSHQQQQRPQQQQQQHVQSLQLPREYATDPPAKKGGARSTSDPSAEKGTVVGGSGESSYYASYLSMPVPTSSSGMVSVLELLSIDEDESCSNLDAIGNNSSNNNGNRNAGTGAQFEAAAEESKLHAAEVAAIVQSMMTATADGEHDIGELRGKVDDQLRTMMEGNQQDVQQWNTQLQQLQQSRERQHGKTSSLAQKQQQQPWRQVQRLPAAAPPKQKDLVSSYNTTKSVSYLQQPQQRQQQLPPQQGREQSRRPSKQPPRPQPTQKMPPSLSARANELNSARSVALVDTASSAGESTSTPWCLDMESATQDLLLMSGQRKVQRQPQQQQPQPQQQQSQQPKQQQPVTIDVLEPSISRDVTVATNNLSGKREEEQSYQQQVSGSRNKASHYAKMVARRNDVNERDGLPVESSPSQFSRLGSNQSRLPQEDPILSARRSKMASKQPQAMALQLDEHVMIQERDEHDYRVSDNRFRPDQPATPASTAAVVPTPRQQRPSKELSDSPPLTRVSSDLSLREEAIRQDREEREERYQLEEQMNVQEQEKEQLRRSRENQKQRYEELFYQQQQFHQQDLQPQHQEQSEFVQQKQQLQERRQKQPQGQQEQSESSQGSRRFFPPDEAADILEQEDVDYEHEGATVEEAAFTRRASKQQEDNDKESQEAANFRYREECLEIIQVPTSPRQSDIIQVPTSPSESVEVSVWNDELTGPVSPTEEGTPLVQLRPVPSVERSLYQVEESEFEESSSGSVPEDYYYDNSDKVAPPPTDSDQPSWTDKPDMNRQQSSKDGVPSFSPEARIDVTAKLRLPRPSNSEKERNLVSKQVGSMASSITFEDVSTVDKAKINELPSAKNSSDAPEEVAAVSTQRREVTTNESPVDRNDKSRRSLVHGARNEDHKELSISTVENRSCESPVDFMREDTVAPSTPEQKKEEHAHDPVYSPRSPDAKEDVPAHPQVTEDVIKISHVRLKALEDPYGDKGQYTGMLVRRKPHGQGTMQYEDGRCYTGDFKFGRWHGNGRALFSNGDLYVGEYDMDQRHGKGRYEWEDGRMYDGNFHRDQRQGMGTYSWADGAVYTGDFFAGQRHGHGTYKFVDGSVYVGEWRSGKYHGVGECKWADNRYYRGEWENGRAHGYGKETRPDGTIRHDGEWKNDRPVREIK
jgi:hypothetical protein